jgi:RNA polymerase sigma-70 factor (ECF subfamily)
VDADDRAVVDGLRAGSAAAFDVAFDRHRDRVWRLLLRLCGRTELAEELLQETFLRLASHGSRLRPDTDLRAWLFTVARNLWRSHRRWAWLDGQRLLELAFRPPRRDPTPHELAAASETARAVERALAEMPDRSREVAVLVLIEKLEPHEAATVLGIRADAVRQRLARAREAIAAEVERGAR